MGIHIQWRELPEALSCHLGTEHCSFAMDTKTNLQADDTNWISNYFALEVPFMLDDLAYTVKVIVKSKWTLN